MQTTTISAAAVIAACFVTAGECRAGPETYICTITGYTMYGNDAQSWVPKDAMATTVAIDRRSGTIIHPWLGTTGYNEVRVLNYGSQDWSFKVFADSGGGGNVLYLEVQEFSGDKKKPFAAVKDSKGYSGYCE